MFWGSAMILEIIAEYVISSLIDKHRDKLPERIVNLMAADDSLAALLKQKILPNSLDALKADYPELQRDQALSEQVIAPAIAHMIYGEINSIDCATCWTTLASTSGVNSPSIRVRGIRSSCRR